PSGRTSDGEVELILRVHLGAAEYERSGEGTRFTIERNDIARAERGREVADAGDITGGFFGATFVLEETHGRGAADGEITGSVIVGQAQNAIAIDVHDAGCVARDDHLVPGVVSDADAADLAGRIDVQSAVLDIKSLVADCIFQIKQTP